jgi:hypothetical protein
MVKKWKIHLLKRLVHKGCADHQEISISDETVRRVLCVLGISCGPPTTPHNIPSDSSDMHSPFVTEHSTTGATFLMRAR